MGLFDRFKKRQDSEDETLFSRFLREFPPGKHLVKPERAFLEKAEKIVPAELIQFWETYGFGVYGEGVIQVIDPERYFDPFYDWLGGVDYTRFPVFMTAFGDIIYYRKLTETEEDFSLLDIHYRKTDVLTYDFDSFFTQVITDKELTASLFRSELFIQAKEKMGLLKENEIYFFAPALVLGGAEDIRFVEKGDAAIHQALLYMM